MSASNLLTLLDASLGSLLPRGITFAVGPIPAESRFRFQAEADRMRSAGDYRKREFVAGRDCARAALVSSGFPEGPISADEDGVPIWPAGALAAISHSRGYCAAIAANCSDYRMLGLDLEMTNRLSRSAIERVVHPKEQSYVQADQKKATLMFCAKEAFFKAQFPVWQTHGNFHDLELGVEDSETGSMKIRHLGKRFPEELRSLASEVQFRFCYFEDFVVSVCWLAR
jgi:4'-phosphopantetheinyl transferase EntD